MFARLMQMILRIRVRHVVAILVVALIWPMPWKYDMSRTVGLTFKLNGNLSVDGRSVDPPGEGQWSWLVVLSRPKTVGEELYSKVFDGSDESSLDIRAGPPESRPAVNVPAAVTTGFNQAGSKAPSGIDAVVNYGILPGSWLGNFSSGGSHGLIIALMTYADVAGEDLTRGRHIAGTGRIRSDGSVATIGNLESKAKAANGADVDVLLIPKQQKSELRGVELSGTKVVPVESLQEAIDWLDSS